jgi:hypothetical protein
MQPSYFITLFRRETCQTLSYELFFAQIFYYLSIISQINYKHKYSFVRNSINAEPAELHQHSFGVLLTLLNQV